MKLALITPKGVFFSKNSAVSHFFKNNLDTDKHSPIAPQYAYWSGGCLGLLIVASLTPSEFEIDFIDENHEDIDFQKDYSLVGLSAMTQQSTRAYEIGDAFRRRGVKVVIGGIHATVMPNEAKEHADSVVIGEAENTWPDLISDFLNNKMKPYYKSTLSVDLTKSPVPRYELLKKYDYKMIWVQTTRGCPRDCEFCAASNVHGKTYRRKTVPQVLNEINYVRALWNEPLINFADDNMFVDSAYSYDLVRHLQQMGLRWTAQTDVSVTEKSGFLELLQKSNCKFLFIGFETLSKRGQIDKHGWKQARIEKYPEIIKKIQAHGIAVLGAFIIGLDDDDATVVDDISSFIFNNRLYAAQISVLTPLPGTRLREKLQREERILSSDWSKYTFVDVNFIPKRMKPEELQSCIIEIYKRVYSRGARLAVVQHFKEIYAKLHERGLHAGDF